MMEARLVWILTLLLVSTTEHSCTASDTDSATVPQEDTQPQPQPQGNNTHTDTALSPSVSDTQAATAATQAVTQPLTVETAPVTVPMTQPATQQIQDSVSPAGNVSQDSSDVDTDIKRSTSSGTALVTMTAINVTTSVRVTVTSSDIVTSSVLQSSTSVLSPALHVAVTGSATKSDNVTSTMTVSPVVASPNVSSSRVSPELSTSPVSPTMSSSRVSPGLTSISMPTVMPTSISPNVSSPSVSSPSVSPNVSSSSVSQNVPLFSVSQNVSSSSVSPNISSTRVSPSTSILSSPVDVFPVVTPVLLNMSASLTNSSLEVSTQSGVNMSTVADIEGSVTSVESMSPTVTPPISTPPVMLDNMTSVVTPPISTSAVTLDNVTTVVTPPISTSTVTLDNMTSVINVSPYVTANTTTTAVDTSTTSTQPTEPGVVTMTTAVTPTNRVYKLTFNGNCSLLELPGFRQQFVKVLSSLIKIKFNITDESLNIAKDIECGSLLVEVQIFNLTDPAPDGKMETLSSLNVTTGNNTFYITLIKVALVPVADDIQMTKTATTEIVSPTIKAVSPTTERPFLYHIDKLLVIIFAIVGGTLLVLAVVVAVFSCRTRRHKSFDLGDTPTANVRLEDFTLTKMTRSHPMYSDQGVIVSLEPHDANSDTKVVTPGSVYQGQQGYFPKTSGPLSTFQPQRLVAVENGGDRMDGGQGDRGVTGRHGSDENLTDAFQAVSPSRTGFDNPSFSSEDILDSGTEDNVEDLQNTSGLTEGATPF